MPKSPVPLGATASSATLQTSVEGTAAQKTAPWDPPHCRSNQKPEKSLGVSRQGALPASPHTTEELGTERFSGFSWEGGNRAGMHFLCPSRGCAASLGQASACPSSERGGRLAPHRHSPASSIIQTQAATRQHCSSTTGHPPWSLVLPVTPAPGQSTSTPCPAHRTAGSPSTPVAQERSSTSP